MCYMQLGQSAYYEGRYSPNESDCLEFAKAKNPLMARSDFFLGMGYAKANDIFLATGKLSVSAREAIELVKMRADHGLPGSNRDRAINATYEWR